MKSLYKLCNLVSWAIRKICFTLNKIFSVLLNPVFFLSTILIAFLINSFFTVPSNQLPTVIQFIVKNRIYTLSLIIVWGIFCFTKNELEQSYDKCNKIKVELEVKNRQIQYNAGLIEAKYGEFAESIKNRNLNSIFERTVKRYGILEACHLYTYEYQRINENIDIKIQFLLGFEQEKTCINVIKQNYYSIEKKLFHELRKIRNLKEETKESEITKSIGKVYEQIESSQSHKSIKYLLSEVVFTILCEKLKKPNIGIKKSTDSSDYDSFRTGILGSILLEGGYIYKYNRRKAEKQGRVYFSTPIVLDSEYVLNICIDGRDLSGIELNDTFNSIVFYIKEEYNKLIGGVIDEKIKYV